MPDEEQPAKVEDGTPEQAAPQTDEQTESEDDEGLSSESEKRIVTEENIIDLYTRGYPEDEIRYFTGAELGKVMDVLSKKRTRKIRFIHWLNANYGAFNFSLGIVAILCAIGLLVSIPTVYVFFQMQQESSGMAKDLMTSQFHFGQGVSYYDVGDYAKALTYFDKALEKQPSNIQIIFYKGNAYFNLGKFLDAENAYAAIIDLDDRNIMARSQKSLALYKQERYGEALEENDRAMNIDKTDRYTNYNRCPMLEKVGRFDEAKKCFFNYWEDTDPSGDIGIT